MIEKLFFKSFCLYLKLSITDAESPSKIGSKGVPKSAGLTAQDFIDALYFDQDRKIEFNSIVSNRKS